MEERRKFGRCKLEQKAKIATEESQDEKGTLIDISTGGMKLVLNKQLKVGSRLTGSFKIVPYLGPFYVQGDVIWVKPKKQGNSRCWEVGVRFNKVSTISI